MDPAFWHRRWAKQEIRFHQAGGNALLRQYWPRLRVPAGVTVFVPLCGKSIDMTWLAEAGHPVIGVELSEVAAEAYFAERGLNPRRSDGPLGACLSGGGVTLHVGDIFALQARDLTEVGACYDRAALIAFPPEMRARYVAQLDAVLPVRAPTLLQTLAYRPGARQGPPFSVLDEEVEALYGGRHALRRLHVEVDGALGIVDADAAATRETVWVLEPLGTAR